MSTTEQILDLGRRWAAAERSGDTDGLAAISTDDFALVGPAGFILDRTQWLGRFQDRKLDITELEWTDVAVRDYGDAAIAIGAYSQKGTVGEQRVDGTFRITHIAVRRDGRWLLAGIHLSFIGPPPAFLGQAGPGRRP